MFEPELEENAEVVVPIVLDLLLQIPRAEVAGVADTAATRGGIRAGAPRGAEPVSYTHLTLPTIYSV